MIDPQLNLTTMLNRAGAGDRAAANELMEHVVVELRRLAGYYMRGEREGQILQPTALVSEVYLKLFHGGVPLSVSDRGHFFAIAARQMRFVLVEQARAAKSIKHGGINVEFDEAFHAAGEKDKDILALDDALNELEKEYSEESKLVELRFFGGYTYEEAAEMMGTNVAKVRRDWEFARAWLLDRIARA